MSSTNHILGCMVAIALFMGTPSAAASASGSEACKAAAAAFAFIESNKSSISMISETFHANFQKEAVRALNQGIGKFGGTSPSPQTLHEFKRSELTSALSCLGVKERAQRVGSVVTDDVGARRLKELGLGTTAFVWHISLPVLNVSQTEGIAVVTAQSNQLAGGTDILVIAKQRDGTWKIVGRRPISLS